MQFLNRLQLWQKLALLVAAMAVPTALLGVFYLSAANSQVAQARNELAGADYAHQVGAVLADVANHRSLLFSVLTGRIVKLGNLVVGRSALNVDPSPQTASLIQIATRDVPGALIASGNVQWYATRASIKGYLGGDDQMALHLYHDEVVGDFAATARDLNGAPAQSRAKIVPALQTEQGAFDSSYGIIESRIINAQKMTITTAELFADSRAISSGLQSLSDLGYSAMDSAVKQRLSQVTTWRNLTVGITIIALAVAFALSWLITRALATP